MDGKFGPDLASVISVLQTALTPAFSLVAVGSLLNVLTGRLARIVDRSRDLQRQYADTDGPVHERVVRELRITKKRIRVVGSSILLAVLSAISVCAEIAVLFNGPNRIFCRLGGGCRIHARAGALVGLLGSVRP